MMMDRLPEECVSAILSLTSPADACRCSVVSSTFQSASDSDLVWLTFLPFDYHHILSRSLFPLHFSSKKQLFLALSRSLLIDGGNKCLRLERCSGKISYILSARELSIAWSHDRLSWTWIPVPQSRFAQVAVLRTVSWLEIQGKIRTGNLTRNTWYTVYMIIKVSERAYGFQSSPAQVSVQVGNRVKSGRAYLHHDIIDNNQNHLSFGKITVIEEEEADHEIIGVPRKRNDGWMEIQVGEFFSGEDDDEEVKMSVMEVGYQLKGGLILEGFEVTPSKQRN